MRVSFREVFTTNAKIRLATRVSVRIGESSGPHRDTGRADHRPSRGAGIERRSQRTQHTNRSHAYNPFLAPGSVSFFRFAGRLVSARRKGPGIRAVLGFIHSPRYRPG